MSMLNSLDLFVLGAFLLFMGLGAWKGLVRTLFQTASWIAGALGAWVGGSHIALFLQQNIKGIPAFGLVAFSGFLGFLLCFICVRLLGSLAHHWVNRSVLGSLNRWGGVIFGACKAAILCALAFLLLGILPLQGELLRTREESNTYRAWSWAYSQWEHTAHKGIIPF